MRARGLGKSAPDPIESVESADGGKEFFNEARWQQALNDESQIVDDLVVVHPHHLLARDFPGSIGSMQALRATLFIAGALPTPSLC